MNVHTGDLIAMIEGAVQRGDRRGRELGFPTANVHLPEADQLDGVYVGTCRVGVRADGPLFVAAVSVSNRPTFYDTQGMRLLEAHLLGFDGDLYGQLVRIGLVTRLRSNRRFADASSLVEQLREDVRLTESWAITNGLEHLLRRGVAKPPSSSATGRSGIRSAPVVRRKKSQGAAKSVERSERRELQIRQALSECGDQDRPSAEQLAQDMGLPVDHVRWFLTTLEERPTAG